MNYTSLTSAFAAAAAVGSLAIGITATATADPDPGADAGNTPIGDAHFKVTNSNKLLTYVFEGYSQAGDQGHGPALGFEIPPGKSVSIAVTKWAQGGHQTLALFKTKNSPVGGKATVTMKSSSSVDQALCSADRGCTPLVLTKTADVSLY